MESILANIAAWGLGFALLSLFITVDKNLRDPGRPKSTKMGILVGAIILASYAFGIGVFAVSVLFGEVDTAAMG